VLLAEFDILKGSQLAHQIPRPTKIKENLLAESMLPEGAHLRESDWTVSFLTNAMMIQADTELRKSLAKARAQAQKAFDPDGTPIPTELPGDSTYVSEVELQDQGYLVMLNLVRTKMDRSVKRGAIVKALAICTRHRFYNIFKPLLMLSLDQYFDATNIDDQRQILMNLYHTINNMPLHMMPLLSPLQQRLSRATRLRTAATPSANDYFNTHVTWASALPASASAAPSQTTSPTHTSSSPPNPNPNPNPSPPGTATLPLRIPISMECDEVLEASVQTLVNRFQSRVMDIYGALLAEKRIIFLGFQQPASICCECVLSACLLISPPIQGTIHRAFPYANLVNMDFLQVPGFIAGVTNPIFEQRNTWWDVLCNISDGTVTFSPAYAEELQQQAMQPLLSPGGGGHTAGGGNTISSHQQSSLSSSSGASSSSSSSSSSADSTSKLSLLDSTFYTDLISGVQLRYGEEWTRCMFRDLTEHFLRLACEEEQFVFDEPPALSAALLGGGSSATRKSDKLFHLSAYGPRIHSFLRSKQFASYSLQREAFEKEGSAFRDMDPMLRKHVRTLQLLSSKRAGGPGASGGAGGGTSASAAADITPYVTLEQHVHGRDQVLELLAMLPESRGGLFPIALGLLHADERVRHAVIELLQRIDAQAEGNKAVSGLNYFLLMTYYRYVRSAGKQIQDYSSDDETDLDGFQPLNPPLFASPSSVYQSRLGTLEVHEPPSPTSMSDLSAIPILPTPKTQHRGHSGLTLSMGGEDSQLNTPAGALHGRKLEDLAEIDTLTPTGEHAADLTTNNTRGAFLRSIDEHVTGSTTSPGSSTDSELNSPLLHQQPPSTRHAPFATQTTPAGTVTELRAITAEDWPADEHNEELQQRIRAPTFHGEEEELTSSSSSEGEDEE
jgi:hypothetical protein